MKTKFALLILYCCASTILLGQTQPGVSGWVDKQIDSALQKDQIGENGQGVDRQRESPSTDSRSTSLVDQSSATDLFSVAANVIPVTPGLSQFIPSTGSTTSDSSAAGSSTATASLYAFLVALNKVSPTDPAFYRDQVFSRRFSFTIGTAASKQATDNTDTPATVYGTKILLVNGRELYTKNNLERLKGVQKAVSEAAKQSAALKQQIKETIFVSLNPSDVDAQGRPDPGKFAAFDAGHMATDAALDATLKDLSPIAMKRINTMIQNSLEAFSKEQMMLLDTYDQISKGRQLSFSYSANIRDAKGNNDHRGELIFDYGLSPRINWTINASGDYTDRKSAADSKGGRFATSFQGNLTKPNSAWGKTPIRLTFSGEGKWQTSQKPQYTFESKLSIPLASGIDLPIVYRYANRIAQIDQASSEARLGLSIDISRLAQAFK
jgi:hypothetical protein